MEGRGPAAVGLGTGTPPRAAPPSAARGQRSPAPGQPPRRHRGRDDPGGARLGSLLNAPPSLPPSSPPSLFLSLSRLSSSLTHWILPAAGLAAASPPAMNPAEGAAEEGAVPDSEVDAFFRTGRGAAGKGPEQRRALPPSRDAELAAARALPAAEPRGGERRGTEGVPACLLALSAAAPRLVCAPVLSPAPGGCYRGAALLPPTASGEDRPGHRPGQAQKPRGDAQGEPPCCRPPREIAPAAPRRALAQGRDGRPDTGRLLEAEPAACPARPTPLCPGKAPGTTPVAHAWAGRAGAPRAVLARSPAAGRGCRPRGDWLAKCLRAEREPCVSLSGFRGC